MEKNNSITFTSEPEKKVLSLMDKVLALHEAIIHNHFKEIKAILTRDPQLLLAKAQNANLVFFEVMSRNRRKQMEWLIRHGSSDFNASNTLKVITNNKRLHVFDYVAYAIMNNSSSLSQDSLEAKIIEEVLSLIPHYFTFVEEFIRFCSASQLALKSLTQARYLKMIENTVAIELPAEIKAKIIFEHENKSHILLNKEIDKIFEYTNSIKMQNRLEDYLTSIGLTLPNPLKSYQIFHTVKYLIVKTLLKNPVYRHVLIIESFRSCFNNDLDELLIEVVKNEDIQVDNFNLAYKYNNRAWKKYRANKQELTPVIRDFNYALALDEKNLGYLYYKLARFNTKKPFLAVSNHQKACEVYYARAYELCSNYINNPSSSSVQGQYYYYLARMYEKGLGTPQNLPAAIKNYQATLESFTGEVLYVNKAKQCLAPAYLWLLTSLTDSQRFEKVNVEKTIIEIKDALLSYDTDTLKALLKTPISTSLDAESIQSFFGNKFNECLANAYRIAVDWHYNKCALRIAISLYNFILWLEPSHYAARLHRANAFRMQEEYVFASADTHYLAANFPQYSDSAYLEIMSVADQHDKDYARSLFKQIVSQENKQPLNLYFRIKVLEQLEMYQDALKELDNALPQVKELNEKFNLLNLKVSILRHRHDYEAALETLNQLISYPAYTVRPDDYLLKAEIYEALGAKILAQFNYQQALEKYALHMQNSYFGDNKNSLTVMRKLKEFDPTFNDGEEDVKKAEEYCQQKLYLQALPLLLRAEKQQKTEKVYTMLAACYYHNNLLSECLEAIINAFITEPAKLLRQNRTIFNEEIYKLDWNVINTEAWLLDILIKVSSEEINRRLSKLLPYEYKLLILAIGQLILIKYPEGRINMPLNNAPALPSPNNIKQFTTDMNQSSAQLIYLQSTLFGLKKQTPLQPDDNQQTIKANLNDLVDDEYETQLLCFKPF